MGAIQRARHMDVSNTVDVSDPTMARLLDGHSNSVRRYAAGHFEGRHLYMEAIQIHCRSSLVAMLERVDA